MKVERTPRGFEVLSHETRPPVKGYEGRLAQQSSIVGNYEDAIDRPGTSALWIGPNHHLNREQVAELVAHLQAWLATGSLERSDRREHSHF